MSQPGGTVRSARKKSAIHGMTVPSLLHGPDAAGRDVQSATANVYYAVEVHGRL